MRPLPELLNEIVGGERGQKSMHPGDSDHTLLHVLCEKLQPLEIAALWQVVYEHPDWSAFAKYVTNGPGAGITGYPEPLNDAMYLINCWRHWRHYRSMTR